MKIDLRMGLSALRRDWILSRGDVEQLPDVTSEYGRLRAADPKLSDLRFQHIRKPLRAQPGRNVTNCIRAPGDGDAGNGIHCHP